MRYLLAITLLVAAGCGGPSVSSAVGASCQSNADCDQQCLGPNKDYPNGFCTLPCRDSRDCPANTACTEEMGGVCLFVCGANSDCGFLGPGWQCQQRDAHGAPGKVNVCQGG